MNSTDKLTVLITGSTGLVGSALSKFLFAGGHDVRRLVRRKPTQPGEYLWDPAGGSLDQAAVEGVDAVVHLAGEGIASGRWTKAQKSRILESREKGTQLVAYAVAKATVKPRVLLTASAIGFYGERGDEQLDETSGGGLGFLAEVCSAWEDSVKAASSVRCVQLRFGVIQNPAGGALNKMLLPFKLGLGGRLGSGEQWTSWIALTDVVRAIHHTIITESVAGPVNIVAPNPVRNSEFTRILAGVLKRPAIFPAPAFMLRLVLGGMADELLLASQRVTPSVLQGSGFEFAHPDLEGALRHELGGAYAAK